VISFVLDQCAWEALHNTPEFEKLHPRILESIERRINRFYLTRLNILELFKGLNESNFDRLRKNVRVAFGYSGAANLLLDPSDHLLPDLKQVDSPFIKIKRRQLCDEIRLLLGATDWPEYESRFGEHIEGYRSVCQDLTLRGQKMRDGVRQFVSGWSKSEKKTNLSYGASGNWFALFCDRVLPTLLRDPKAVDIDTDLLQERSPALVYFSELNRSISHSMVSNGRKWDSGDSFDLIYPMYLDVADYLVTQDKGLRALFRNTGNPYLENRAITVEKLLEHIHKPHLLSRSPINGSDIDIYDVKRALFAQASSM
jgi:hypothetical protein